jgi:hypothetical protein
MEFVTTNQWGASTGYVTMASTRAAERIAPCACGPRVCSSESSKRLCPFGIVAVLDSKVLAKTILSSEDFAAHEDERNFPHVPLSVPVRQLTF